MKTAHRHSATSLAAILIAAFAAAPLRADVQDWSLCTPGAFRTCASVSITTLPVLTNGVRTGTSVVIAMANLQGSGLPGTSNQLSGLYQVVFSGPGGLPTTLATQSPVLTGPGASGGLAWRRVTTTFAVGAGLAWIELLGEGPSGPNLLGGCATGSTVGGPITASTCGAGALAVFSFTFGGILDASQIDDVFIAGYGPNGSASCGSDPSASPFHQQPCDILSSPPTVVPAPLSVLLLATGLAGVGAVRRRRGNAAAD